jgi:hypothetical protein
MDEHKRKEITDKSAHPQKFAASYRCRFTDSRITFNASSRCPRADREKERE